MDDQWPKVVATYCLAAIVIVAEVGITIVAIGTDRDLLVPQQLTFVLALCVPLLGGVSLSGFRQRHRWQVSREDIDQPEEVTNVE